MTGNPRAGSAGRHLLATLLVLLVAVACGPAPASPSPSVPALSESPLRSDAPGTIPPSPSPIKPTPTPANPSPPAQPTPTSLPTAPASPSPSPPSTIVSHGDRASDLVALTFDMGGRAEPVVPIMTWLRDNRIPATIFVAGSVIDSRWTDVGRRTVEIMEARPNLFEMASHGYNHPDMRTQTAVEIAAELRRTEESLAQLGARSARPLFRPPSGYQNALVLRVAGELGYPWTVLWDVDPLDWKTVEDGGPTADEIVTKVVGSSRGGSIVLLHLSGTQTLEALPGIVEGLRAKGLRIAVLGELLGL